MNQTNQAEVAQRLRLFLLILSALIYIGAMIELWFTEHTESWLQLLPFALCGLGLLALLLVLFRPQRSTLLASRLVMSLVLFGGLFGIYEHIEHNLAFELEIRPNAIASELVMEALGGANPLLAPGILALGAVLALAATYYHPKLTK